MQKDRSRVIAIVLVVLLGFTGLFVYSGSLTGNAFLNFNFFKSTPPASTTTVTQAKALTITQSGAKLINPLQNVGCIILDPINYWKKTNFSSGVDFCKQRGYYDSCDAVKVSGKSDMDCGTGINCANESQYKSVNETVYVDKNITVQDTVLVNETTYVDELTFVPYSINKILILNGTNPTSVGIPESNVKNLQLQWTYFYIEGIRLATNDFCNNPNNYPVLLQANYSCISLNDFCNNPNNYPVLLQANYSCKPLVNGNGVMGIYNTTYLVSNSTQNVVVGNEYYLQATTGNMIGSNYGIIDYKGERLYYQEIFGFPHGAISIVNSDGTFGSRVFYIRTIGSYSFVDDLNVSTLSITKDKINSSRDSAVLNVAYKGVKPIVTQKAVTITKAVNVTKQVTVSNPVIITKQVLVGYRVNCYSNPGKNNPVYVSCCKGAIQVPPKVQPKLPLPRPSPIQTSTTAKTTVVKY